MRLEPNHILISGIIESTTAFTYQTYTLVDPGYGFSSLGAEVSGLNGDSLFTEAQYQPYQNEILGLVQSASDTFIAGQHLLEAQVEDVTKEVQIATRELSRARIWYAQSTIASATRSVPADMPSHIEVELAAADDIDFTTPISTFYRIYYYPNSLDASKPSKEVRSASPPTDGSFYLVPDLSW